MSGRVFAVTGRARLNLLNLLLVVACDIGLNLLRNEQGDLGFRVLVGGGLGRTPLIGRVIREFLPQRDLLTYLEAILQEKMPKSVVIIGGR